MSDLEDLGPIERELRDGRPAPSGSFLDSTITRIVTVPVPVRRSAWHLRLALLATVLAVAAFGAIGGFGAVSSAAKSASARASDVVRNHHDSDKGDKGHKGGKGEDGHHGQGEGDDQVCEDHHRSRRMHHSEARRLVSSHHGEYGPCPIP